MDSYSDMAQESEDPMRTPLIPQDPPTVGFFETLYQIDQKNKMFPEKK